MTPPAARRASKARSYPVKTPPAASIEARKPNDPSSSLNIVASNNDHGV
jgi:hypothetical protein